MRGRLLEVQPGLPPTQYWLHYLLEVLSHYEQYSMTTFE
jgi:hypothetical protein